MSVDLYWAGVWADGSTVSWLSLTLAERQRVSGSAKLPAWLRWRGGGDPLEWLLEPARLDRTLATLAVVDAWRTATTVQVAEFTGHDVAKAKSKFWAAMWLSGLLDVGFASAGLLWDRGQHSPVVLVRPAKTHVYERSVEPRLTFAERLAVTGGERWLVSRQADRHNILCTQLALHAARLPGVGVVHGEKWANAGLLGFDAAGLPRPGDAGTLSLESTQASADLVVVREDGLKIAVELTASTSSTFMSKVNRWAHVLSLSPLDRSGLVVLFLNASTPERYGHIDARIRQAVTDAIATAPAADKGALASRVGVAGWHDWFPGLDQVTDAGRAFTVDTPRIVGESVSWDGADWLDARQRPVPHSERLLEPLSLTHLSASVPHWLRQPRRGPALWRTVLEAHNIRGLVTPTPRRPERVKGRKSGQPVGVAGPAVMPRRLTHPVQPPTRNTESR